VNKFTGQGFVNCNGNIEVNGSLWNGVLHDKPQIEN
jgi:hypothetical protein